MTAEASQAPRCANHPDRETLLRCNRCEKPICLRCAVLTEVGYRCKECVRGQQALFYTATSYDLPLAFGISLVLGGIAGVLAYLFLGLLGWFSLIAAFVAGPVAGGIVAEAVRRAVRKRRARHMRWVVAAGCVIGVILGGLLVVILPDLGAGGSLADLGWILSAVFFRWDVLLFAALAASTIYTRHL